MTFARITTLALLALLAAVRTSAAQPHGQAAAEPSVSPAPAHAEPADTPEGGPRARHARPPQDPLEVVLPDGRAMVEVGFELDSNKIVVPVSIAGKGPFDFVLDTGAAGALLDDPVAAASLDLAVAGQAMVAGAGGDGGRRTIDLATGVTFGIGGLELRGGMLAVTPAEESPLMPGAAWQGVIGRQLFASTVVEIDWQRRRLRLHDPAAYRPPADAAVEPLHLDGTGHVFLDAEVAIGAEAPRTVTLVVDTGANHALALAPSAGAPPAERIENAVLGHGVGGVVRGHLARVRSLRVGGVTFDQVVASFPRADQIPVIGGNRDGNLGAETLRRFRTTFDYANRRLLLEPAADLDAPFAFSTSGVYLRPWPAEDGEAVVEHVYDGSPAARAGIAVGDRIVGIDGERATHLGLAELRARLEAEPGTEVRLEVLRDDAPRTVVLTLERLL